MMSQPSQDRGLVSEGGLSRFALMFVSEVLEEKITFNTPLERLRENKRVSDSPPADRTKHGNEQDLKIQDPNALQHALRTG
jgi:hypothetical protein